MQFVPCGFRKAIPSDQTDVGRGVGQAESRFRDHPRIAGTFDEPNHGIGRVGFLQNRPSGGFISGPRDDDMGIGLDFEQGHTRPYDSKGDDNFLR